MVDILNLIYSLLLTRPRFFGFVVAILGFLAWRYVRKLHQIIVVAVLKRSLAKHRLDRHCLVHH